MRCSKCGSENPENKKFCGKCGARLGGPCVKCGAENPPHNTFCGDCGAPLSDRVSAGRAKGPATATEWATVRISPEATEILDGERKTVTALFADIKGSMDLMEDLDPEEARAIVDPALKLMMDAVHRYGGYVAQSTGDGIFALFGAPIAHEDHPQLAVYAALRMQDEMRRYSAKLRQAGNLPLEARVGVNSGEVVVRSIATGDGHIEYTPIGHSISLAARMQALAPTGSIAVTDTVRRLIEGYFSLKALGPTKIKGVSEPVEVFEVTGLGPLRTRLQRAASRGYTKFVGREREMEALGHAAELARQGHGQIVAAVAEPGVGKSRLFYEFQAKNRSGWMVLEAMSFSHGKASAYLPVLDLLHSYFRIEPEEDTRTRREKVNGKVLTLDRALEDALPHLFALLGLIEGDDPFAGMDAQVRRARTIEALKRIVLRESLNQPLIVVFEDLHWIDQETQEFLNLLADSIATSRLLLLVNYRPEYSHSWGSKTYYTQIRLDPLGKESAEEMLSARIGNSSELNPLKRLVLERTEGNPLFIEELVEALFDEGVLVRNGTVKLTRPLSQLKIPLTVQGILAARIDRLPPDAKELLQTLAVIGTEFPLSLARQVVQLPDDRLDLMLSRLQTGEFIYEQPASGDVEYTFKHALTHDVAYNSTLLERRKALHERIGNSIDALYCAHLDDHIEELAHHFRRSDNTVKAVDYLRRAGERLVLVKALQPALNHFRAAANLVEKIKDSSVRDREEAEICKAAIAPTIFAVGEESIELEQLAERALAIGASVNDRNLQISALHALWMVNLVRADLAGCGSFANRLMEIAEEVGDPLLRSLAHFDLAAPQFWGGHFRAALDNLERSIMLSSGPPNGDSRQFYLPRAMPWAYASHCRWYLGYPDQALDNALRAISTAREMQADYMIGLSQEFLGKLHSLRREWPDARDVLGQALAFSNLRGFPFVAQFCALDDRLSLYESGVEPNREWLKATVGQCLTDVRIRLAAPQYLQMCARLLARIGQYDEAQRVLEHAFVAAQGGVHCFQAELYRTRGELSVVRSPSSTDSAEQCFREAVEVARQQCARSLELRAITSLARLLRDTNRREEARAMLAEIYNWFTEGFDTADLKDAKALLEELVA